MINGKTIKGKWITNDIFIAKNDEIFRPVLTLCIGNDKPLFLGSNGTIAEVYELINEKEL